MCLFEVEDKVNYSSSEEGTGACGWLSWLSVDS